MKAHSRDQQWTPTHVGWFVFCPVEVRFVGTDGIQMRPRWRFVEPLLPVAGFFEVVRIALLTLLNPNATPRWMVLVKPIS